MKKLKKGLSLLLVLAMVFSLVSVVFAAHPAENVVEATGYTDDADASYGYNAVQLLSGMGILNGRPNGSFGYKDNFTRAEAAKIVTYLVFNAENEDQLINTATKFNDVAGHWGAKWIAYATNRGIIAGYNDTTFGPDDTLTKNQWIKMLLVALGYKAEQYGLVGPDWEANTVDAAVNGVGSKAAFLTQADYALPFNRETAAYYAQKALFYSEDRAYTVTEDKGNGVTVSYTTYPGSMAEEVYHYTTATTRDIYGRVWGSEVDYVTGKEYTNNNSNPVLKYSTKTTIGQIAKDLGSTTTPISFEIWEDGIKIDGKGYAAAHPADDKELIGGQGTLTEVYWINPGFGGEFVAKIIMINTFVTEIAAADIVPGDKLTPAYVNIANQTSSNGTTPLLKSSKSYKSGDVVIYTTGHVYNGALQNGDPTMPVLDNEYKQEGDAHILTAQAKLTKVLPETYYVGLDGEDVYVSRFAKKVKDAAVNSNQYFYYDFYGNVIYVKKVPAAKINYKYAYAVAFAAHEGFRFEDNAFDFTVDAKATVYMFDYTATGENQTAAAYNVAVHQAPDGEWYYDGTGMPGIPVVATDEYVNVSEFVRYYETPNGIVIEPIKNETLSVKFMTEKITAADEAEVADYYQSLYYNNPMDNDITVDRNLTSKDLFKRDTAEVKFANDKTPLYRIIIEGGVGKGTVASIYLEDGCNKYTTTDYEQALVLGTKTSYVASELAGVVRRDSLYDGLYIAINCGNAGEFSYGPGTVDKFKLWAHGDDDLYVVEENDESDDLNDPDTDGIPYNVVTYKVNTATGEIVPTIIEGDEYTVIENRSDDHYFIVEGPDTVHFTGDADIVKLVESELEDKHNDVSGCLYSIDASEIQKDDTVVCYDKDGNGVYDLIIVIPAEKDAPPAETPSEEATEHPVDKGEDDGTIG